MLWAPELSGRLGVARLPEDDHQGRVDLHRGLGGGSGRVIRRNSWTPFAPSTRAASVRHPRAKGASRARSSPQRATPPLSDPRCGPAPARKTAVSVGQNRDRKDLPGSIAGGRAIDPGSLPPYRSSSIAS